MVVSALHPEFQNRAHRLTRMAVLVNHIDGIKHHNWLWNLEYVTSTENNRHAFATGLNWVGERHGSAKLTVAEVKYTRASSRTARDLAAELGVGDATVKDVRRGRTWRHVK